MKNIFLFYLLASTCIFSCSNESINETNIDDNELSLTNFIQTSYNVSNTPNTQSSFTNYAIQNNKLISYSVTNLLNDDTSSGAYSYQNDLISEILTYNNGVLSRIQSYSYDTNGDLIEYLSESINTDDQVSSYDRHSFTHTTDTIYSSWTRNQDGNDFDTLILTSKIVLDNNNNRTYYESYSPINDLTKFWVSSYDTNQNILNEAFYSRQDNQTDVLLFENSYITNSSENLYNRINEATYTRKTMMLLYHLQPGAINNINAKSITRNMLINFNSTFGNSFATYDISHSLNEDNDVVLSDFKTIVDGAVLTRFTHDFIFQ